jgi:hypothetical protein
MKQLDYQFSTASTQSARTGVASTALLAVFFPLAILLFGCASVGHRLPKGISEVYEFERKHPIEYKDFLYLNPVNMDTYHCTLGDQLAVASNIKRGLTNKFGATPGLNEYVEAKFQQELLECENRSRHYFELEALCSPRGAICQFGWTDGTTKEIGLLVIKDGDIVKRDVWVVDYLKEAEGDTH